MGELDPMCDEIRSLGGSWYQAFLDAGFREYYTGHCNEAVFGTPYLLQKRIKDEDGDTLYFVNVLVFDARKWRQDVPLSYKPECHFSRNGVPFSVTMLRPSPGPVEIEDFFSDVFWGMGCDWEDH